MKERSKTANINIIINVIKKHILIELIIQYGIKNRFEKYYY